MGSRGGLHMSRKALFYRPGNTSRRDVVFAVIRQLLVAAIIRHREELLNALRLHIRIENDLSVQVPRRTTGGLDEAGLTAQKPLFVSIQNRDQRYFGQVESLAQQVDSDEHVELTLPQRSQDFHTLNGVNLAVQILNV